MSKLFVACIAIFFVGFTVADPGWRTANTMHALPGEDRYPLSNQVEVIGLLGFLHLLVD
jgi:hypothetical protein